MPSMSDEYIVLLLDSERLPPGLKEALTKKNVLFETGSVEEIFQILPVLEPDLVIQPSGPRLLGLLQQVNEEQSLPPLVVVVERSALGALREENHPAIFAYVPSDLAPAAIAHRIANLAKKQSEVPTPSTKLVTKSPPVVKQTTPDARVVLPPREGPRSTPVRQNIEQLKSIRIQNLRSPSSGSELKSRQNSVASRENSLSGMNTGDTLRAAAAPPGPSEGSPAKGTEHKFSVAPHGALPQPVTPEFSVLMPIPVNAREALTVLQPDLQKLRLALLDTDLTRADSLTNGLRARGILVHPVTPDPVGTRWPLLRRFAPQGLVVDEKSLTRGSSEWVERFRGDPFLRHVPLIVLRFSRLFQDDNAEAKLEPLLKSIEHLGKEEFALLEKLKPGRQVDLSLAQVPPLRLLMMLTSEDRNTRLDCRDSTERMVWNLGPGYAGKAKVLNPGSDQVIAQLTPEEALTWLISREDCQVAVHEHTEPLAHASESRDALALMEEITDKMEAPSRHESIRPAMLIIPLRESAPSIAEFDSKSPNERSSQSNTSPPAPTSSSSEQIPASSSSMEEGTAKRNALHGLLPRMRQIIVEKVLPPTANFFSRILSRFPKKTRMWIVLGVPLALLGLGALLIFSDRNNRREEPSANESSISQARSGAKNVPVEGKPQPQGARSSTTAEKTDPPSMDPGGRTTSLDATEASQALLFAVAPDAALPSCKEKLGDARPKLESVGQSVAFYRQARGLLMKGQAEEAWKAMCSAGLLDPQGPAADGLAEFYLSRRSLGEAEYWIQSALRAAEPRRTSQELHGDIESQKGHAAEARRIWLDTMKLSGDEEKKLQLIARNHIRNSKQAQKGGDLARAEREIRRAVTLWSTDVVAAIEFAEILARSGQLDGASRWASQARQLDPSSSYALLVSGRIAQAQNHSKEAVAFFDQIPQNEPFYREAQSRKSRLKN